MSAPTNVAIEAVLACRLIPVMRFGSAEAARAAIDCVLDAGLSTVEVTMTTPGALELIGALKAERRGTLIGAGTVLDPATARACLSAGADYLVSPCLVPELAQAAHDAGKVALIGALTPSEVIEAHRLRADAVKVFPANLGGPAYLRTLKTLFPHIHLVPTGGLTAENLGQYLAAGASAVGVGNNLIDAEALARGDREAVVAGIRRFVAALPQ